MFVINGTKYLWLDPVKLGNLCISGMDLYGSIYFEQLPLSDNDYRKKKPTQAQIIFKHESIVLVDDFGESIEIKYKNISHYWFNLLMITAKENDLVKVGNTYND